MSFQRCRLHFPQDGYSLIIAQSSKPAGDCYFADYWQRATVWSTDGQSQVLSWSRSKSWSICQLLIPLQLSPLLFSGAIFNSLLLSQKSKKENVSTTVMAQKLNYLLQKPDLIRTIQSFDSRLSNLYSLQILIICILSQENVLF